MDIETTSTAAAQQPRPPQGNGRRIRGMALISVLTALMLTLLLEALDLLHQSPDRHHSVDCTTRLPSHHHLGPQPPLHWLCCRAPHRLPGCGTGFGCDDLSATRAHLGWQPDL